MFLDAFFLQIFEHVSSTTSPLPLHPLGGGGIGGGWGWGEGGVFLDCFFGILRGGMKGMGQGGRGEGGVFLDRFLEFLEGV